MNWKKNKIKLLAPILFVLLLAFYSCQNEVIINYKITDSELLASDQEEVTDGVTFNGTKESNRLGQSEQNNKWQNCYVQSQNS